MARLRRSCLLLAVGCCLLVDLSEAVAQEPPATRVTCNLGASGGARRYRSGVWGVVEVFADNPTNEPVEAQSIARFVDDPLLQYGRRVLVPAKSFLRTTCPVRIPELPAGQARAAYFMTEQVLPPPRVDGPQQTHQDAMLGSKLLLLDPELPAVAMIGDFDALFPPVNYVPYHTGEPDERRGPDELIYELVLAAKRANKLSRRVSIFDSRDLPFESALLDVVDVLVLSTDRLAADPGGITTVRDWVLGGGRLWILLDEVQPDTVAALMGDAFATAVVDRVDVTHLEMSNARLDPGQRTTVAIDLEQSVDHVRVVPVGVTVTDTVNGWPAAFWQPMGAGRVFFTTLSTAAWMRSTQGSDPPPRTDQDHTFFFSRETLVSFAEECMVKRPASDMSTSLLQPFLTQQIGYRIVSRSTVAALLGVFCGILAVAGAWFFRTGRPERLLWLTPVAVAVASLVFVGIATATKKSVPPTVATIARVAFEPGVGTGHSFGLAAMYNQETCDDPLGAEQGGVFFPDMTAMEGQRRRIVWTDQGAWHWEDLELPAGVRTAPFQRPVPLHVTVDCRAQFGPTGLQGTLGPVPFTELQDVVIAVPHQPIVGVKIDEQGAFTARPQDLLAPGDFSVETLLGDRQRRRKTVYQQVFTMPPAADEPAIPVLYAWTEAVDSEFIFPQSRQLSSTLMSIPIRLQPSPAGTQVVVPATFLPYRAVSDSRGKPPSAYANLMHRWGESKLAVSDWLRFQLPPAVLPIRLSRATLTLTVRAPSRSLQLLVLSGGTPTEVLSLSHPIGTYSVVLDREELLQLDDRGGLLLIVQVGQDETAKPLDQMSEATWLIESLQLEVAGTVQSE